MKIDELDESQGLTTEMVREWLTAQNATFRNGHWTHPDKVLTARLALQKAEDEVQRMESRKSAAMADLSRYLHAAEKDLDTYREQIEAAGKKAMSPDLIKEQS